MPHDTSPDPYAPPASSPPAPDHAAPRRIVGGWEGRRLLFNVILLFPGLWILAILAWQGLHVLVLAFMALAVAAGANACYLLGPLTELYLAALAHSPELPRLRRLLFWAGTTFSVIAFLILLALLTSQAALSSLAGPG